MSTATDIFRRSTPILRVPNAEDGPAIWELIRSSKPLDENSVYCNLLQCDHFSETCVVAERAGEIVGWVSGYIMPNDPETLFIWQVAVSEKARGTGLGGLMLQSLRERDVCKGVNRLQTTITGENEASWSLFRKFADKFGTKLDAQPYFSQTEHFRGEQSTEHLVTIKLRESAAVRNVA